MRISTECEVHGFSQVNEQGADMRMLVVSDLHSRVEIFEEILRQNGSANVVILPGDITHFGSRSAVADIIARAQSRGLTVLAVAGNCDTAEVDEELRRLDVALDGSAKMIANVGFHGVSASPPWQSKMYHRTEEEIIHALEAGYQQLGRPQWHVVVCHVPPYRTKLDRMHFGQHGGSKAVRQFIEERQPHLVLCGHIHEARGLDQLGNTQVVNAGHGARGFYAIVDLRQDEGPEVILAQVT